MAKLHLKIREYKEYKEKKKKKYTIKRKQQQQNLWILKLRRLCCQEGYQLLSGHRNILRHALVMKETFKG